MNMKIKKILKDIAITLLIATVVLNIISFIKKPDLPFKEFPKIDSKLIDGSDFKSEELKGKPFIVHFWATWCPTCKVEIPNYQRLIEEGYKVITVAVQSGSDKDIREYLQKRDLTLPTINDPNGKLAKLFKVEGFPTTFVFDKNSELFFSDVGYTSDLSLKIKVWLSSLQ
jgi:thiol-disulfide isomerase/thioredoxin